MSDKYTYADVIIDPNDPRVEIGAEYYYCDNPSTCLERANKKDVAHLAVLEKVYPDAIGHFFIDDAYSICIIRKKEPVKRYVPFDLNEWEQAMMLGACWLINKDHRSYHCITAIYPDENLIYVEGYGDMSPEELLEWFIFAHDNTPCGKLVKEE